jgi:hypothetical protein
VPLPRPVEGDGGGPADVNELYRTTALV